MLVPAGHPLADHKSVRLKDVAGEAFVDMPTGFGQRQIVHDAFTRAKCGLFPSRTPISPGH
ncbi:hypothetical protein GCM10010300_22990 [Streptomyces olivaceoviridis]|uniref:LysR substrate-binding domain-containing protein n=1 Tax=Streptomyces olivaceoviridis TaxID=1921 RepID=UPI001998F6D8|nr:LysR substrate-binding domain-containing protein [Streptomyces olivaceoviridis]GGY78698.1 hypothetical protein GCM10010300_22990 [Streptomyces olivaceoviridis]